MSNDSQMKVGPGTTTTFFKTEQMLNDSQTKVKKEDQTMVKRKLNEPPTPLYILCNDTIGQI